MARAIQVANEIAEQGGGAIVADLGQLGDQRLACPAGDLVQRLHENRRRLVAAIEHQALDGLALHQRLVVLEQRQQLAQSFGTAELPEQEGGRTPHFPVRRAHQLLDDVAPLRAEAGQHVAQPPPLHRLVRNLAQEHQRRELHDVPSLLLDQVQEHRNRERGQTGEEQRREERHHRTRESRSRVLRYVKSA